MRKSVAYPLYPYNLMKNGNQAVGLVRVQEHSSTKIFFSLLIHYPGLLTVGLVWLDFQRTIDFKTKVTELYNRIRTPASDLHRQSNTQISPPKTKHRSTFMQPHDNISEHHGEEHNKKTAKFQDPKPFSKMLSILFFFITKSINEYSSAFTSILSIHSKLKCVGF